MTDDGGSADWERLHPATILLLILRNGANLLIAALFILGGGANARSSGIDLLLGMLFIGPPLVTYITSRYRLDATAVHWQRGLLVRQRRDLPRSQIQSVDTSIGLIGRLFGLETVTISTAGGGASEIVIGLISQESAHRLRVQLTPGPELAPPAAGHARLLDRAALSGEPAPPVFPGAPAGLATALPPLPELEHRYGHLVGADAPRVALANLGPRMIGIAVRSYGLKAVRFGDRIRTTSGLVQLETRETTRARLQGLERRQTLMARRMGTEEIVVDTADASGLGATMSLLLDPIAPSGRWESVAEDLISSGITETDLGPVSPVAIRRRRVRALLQTLATAAVYGGYVAAAWVVPDLVGANVDDRAGQRSAATIGAVVLFGLDLVARQWCAGRRHRNHRYALDRRHVAVQQGCTTTTLTVVPRTSTQAVTVRANYFQRRLGLATISIDNTALGLGAVTIVDVTDSDASGLAADLLDDFVSRPV